MCAGLVWVSSGLGLQTLPITGWTVKTVAVPSIFVSGACSGSLQSSGAPGLIGSYSVRPLADRVVAVPEDEVAGSQARREAGRRLALHRRAGRDHPVEPVHHERRDVVPVELGVQVGGPVERSGPPRRRSGW